jgi:hypothetical protein
MRHLIAFALCLGLCVAQVKAQSQTNNPPIEKSPALAVALLIAAGTAGYAILKVYSVTKTAVLVDCFLEASEDGGKHWELLDEYIVLAADAPVPVTNYRPKGSSAIFRLRVKILVAV